MTNPDVPLRELSRDFIARLDGHDWESIDRRVAAGCTAHVGAQTLDRAAWMHFGKAFYGAFPDGAHRVVRQVVEGDTVVTVAEWSGTHQGDFMGIPATGRRVSFPLIVVDRFADGLIVEHWGQFDSAAMMRQLGVG